MVDGDDDRAGEVHPLGLEADGAAEGFLCHAGIAAVAVHLVEGGGEVDGGVVSLGRLQGGADDGRGIGAGCKNGTGNAGLLLQRIDTMERVFCLAHSIIDIR